MDNESIQRKKDFKRSSQSEHNSATNIQIQKQSMTSPRVSLTQSPAPYPTSKEALLS